MKFCDQSVPAFFLSEGDFQSARQLVYNHESNIMTGVVVFDSWIAEPDNQPWG
jgi:hypothetical protein